MGYNPWGHKEWDMTKHISELELNMTLFYSLSTEDGNSHHLRSEMTLLAKKENGLTGLHLYSMDTQIFRQGKRKYRLLYWK